jgi:hypothetical protein
MSLDNETIYMIAGVIAIVVIVALLLAKKVGFKLNKDSLSLFADKNKDKDTVSTKGIKKSKVDIKNREGQDINVEDVSDDSDVKIR